MRDFAYSATERGIRERRERKLLSAAPVPTPSADNVVQFRRPIVRQAIRRLPTASDFSRAKHLKFLATLHITTRTPFSVLIGRVAAWHGFTAEQMIESHGPRNRIEARADCVLAIRQTYPKTSMPRLGQIFGNRDHTTVLHYLRKRGL